MSLLETIENARAFLERNRRVSLRVLKLEFELNDDQTEALVEELVDVQQVAALEGKVLSWIAPAPSDARAADAGTRAAAGERRASATGRDPRAYTPKHLTDKILKSKSALEGERKQVTVLFADVKGSMELAAQIDPEDWHGILDRFFQILTEGVHRFEGTVNQYTGDGIMALFGAPIAHEDHAQRACYAALHLRDALREFGQELRRGRGLDFLTRIGVNSGEVVVGKIGDDLRMDYTAQGHTVGLAERTQQLAEPGKPYLTASSAALVRGYFQLEDLGEFSLKGVAAPVRVYGLEGRGTLRTRLEISQARGFSRFVGRVDEMATLELALHRAQESDGQVVGVVGQAGVGKSRLCLQFVERCRARGIRVLEAHCPAHGQTVPLRPILELLRSAFGITPEDTDQTAREKIAGRLLLLDRAFDDVLPLVFDFLGVPDPAQPPPPMDPEVRQRQLYGFVRRLVQARSAREPAVLLFDDIQWIDQGSDAYLARLVEATRGTRTLLLANFRPEYRAEWMGKADYQQLPLSPLGPEAIDELLHELLGTDPTLGGLQDLIRQRTGGNPFFIEEVVQSLAASESLSGTRGAYRLVTPIEELAIPATVQAVLAARIDRLPAREKHVLQTAAVATVVAKRCSESLLGRVAELSGSNLAAALARLLAAEFLVEETLYPEVEYGFKHPLTQEVAYRAQLGEQRRRGHQKVAGLLEERYVESLDEHAALLAHHWEAAGDAQAAARWHARAAAWTGARVPAESTRHWRKVRALSSGAAEDPASTALHIEACIQLINYGARVGFDEAEVRRLFEEARPLAERLGDRRLLARLIERYAICFAVLGRGEECLRWGQAAIEIAEEVGDPELRVVARIAVATEHYFSLGNLRKALAECERAIAISGGELRLGVESLGFHPLLFWLMLRGFVWSAMGELARARGQLDDVLELARELDDREVLCWASSGRAISAIQAGQLAEARAHADRSAQYAMDTGSVLSRVYAFDALASVSVAAGQWDNARGLLENELRASRELGLSSRVRTLALLARVEIESGRTAEARDAIARGLEIAQRRGQHIELCRIHLARAQLLLREGGASAADQIDAALQQAETAIRRTGAEAFRPEIHELRAELARQCADPDGRERELREAHHLFIEMGATGHAERLARELSP